MTSWWHNLTIEQKVATALGITLGSLALLAAIISIIIFFITNGTMILTEIRNTTESEIQTPPTDSDVYIKNRTSDKYLSLDTTGTLGLTDQPQKWSIRRFVGPKIQINSDNGIDIYFRDRGFKSNTLLGNSHNWPGKSQIYNIFQFIPITNKFFAIKIYRNINCTSNKCLHYDEKDFYWDYDKSRNIITPNGSTDTDTSHWYIESP